MSRQQPANEYSTESTFQTAVKKFKNEEATIARSVVEKPAPRI